MKWYAMCTKCGTLTEEGMNNGIWVESIAKHHAKETKHAVYVAYKVDVTEEVEEVEA